MSVRWTDLETSTILFINAYNKAVTEDGYKNLKYTNAQVFNIWNNDFTEQSRGFESLKHKLRLESFDLDTAILEFLSSNKISTIMDMAKYFNIFEYLARRCIDYYELKYMKKFYDRYTEELYTDDLKETIEENPVVDHTIKIDTGNEPELVTKVIEPDPIETPIVEKSKDIEIPEAPIKKKGKNSYKKLTKKSKVKTLAEAEEEEKPEPFAAMKKLVNSYKVHIKIGVIGDTHIGNTYCDENMINSFYKRCNDLGIKYIIHAGDLVDGHNMYTGQAKEQTLHGFEEQVKYVISNYPKYDGMVTYIISGNHDMCYFNNTTLHPLVSIARARPDIIYANDYYANIDIDGIKICMIHTDGNSGSEPMTKLKKLINNKTEDCDILVMGHLHQSMELRDYCGVAYACAPGSFLKTNSYTIRRGFNCTLGGYILDIEKNMTTGKLIVTSTWIGEE